MSLLEPSVVKRMRSDWKVVGLAHIGSTRNFFSPSILYHSLNYIFFHFNHHINKSATIFHSL